MTATNGKLTYKKGGGDVDRFQQVLPKLSEIDQGEEITNSKSERELKKESTT